MKINLITLCSGIEAQGQAMRKLCRDYPGYDWDMLAWSEIDKDAIRAHDAIFPEYADRNLGDMTIADYSKITEPVDVLFYSTPCQSVSVAGQNKGMKEGTDAASALIWHTRRAIESLKPKVCILENVKGMIMGKNLKEFHKWQSVMESYGYTNFAKVLNSKDFGCPQNRERLFMISIRDCDRPYHFPKPFKLEKRIKDILEPYGTVDESFYFKPEQLLRIIANSGKDSDSDIQVFGRVNYSQDGIVVTDDSISPCHCVGHGNMPKVAERIKEGISIHPLNRKMEFQGFRSIQSDTEPCLTAHDGRGGEPCLWERTDRIIKLGNYTPNGTHAGMLVSVDGVAPTVMGQHGTVTGVVEPMLQQRLSLYDNNAQAGRVYDVEGIAPTVKCHTGGNSEPKILTPVRTEESKELRRKGIEVFMHRELVPRKDGICNTITTVTKDNLLQEPCILSYTRDDKGKVCDRHNKDIANTVHTSTGNGGNTDQLVKEPIELSFANLPDKTVLQDEDGKGYLWQDGSLWRVRKLVPMECGRLMDCSDEDIRKMIDAGISKTALYSLFGNSIVVSVLYYIFLKLWIEPDDDSAQKSLFDF